LSQRRALFDVTQASTLVIIRQLITIIVQLKIIHKIPIEIIRSIRLRTSVPRRATPHLAVTTMT
jgi:hypothetical protein